MTTVQSGNERQATFGREYVEWPAAESFGRNFVPISLKPLAEGPGWTDTHFLQDHSDFEIPSLTYLVLAWIDPHIYPQDLEPRT